MTPVRNLISNGVNLKYVDAHCHLQFEQYAQDREDIIARMRDEGVVGIVVGTDLQSSEKAVALAGKHEHLFASVGLHPNHADEPFETEAFHQLAQHPKVVAIGECGLDYFLPFGASAKEGHSKIEESVQKEIFKKHIALAAELDKPLIIHARTPDAYRDLITILTEAKIEHPNLRGDIHFFSGSLAEAQTLIALNFTISFTAVITFARDYDEIIKTVPLANILAETDAPYVAPATRRGERNDPLAVIDVVAKIAEIRGEDIESVRTTLLANAEHLFTLD